MDDRPPPLLVAVCLGNICRSPIAEAVLRARCADAGLDVRVISAGTGTWHEGEDADPRARAVLAEAGYALSHRAQRFDPAWFADAELVLAMDHENLRTLRALAPDRQAHDRVRLIRSFDPALAHLPERDPRLAVDDPYYGTPADFARTLDDVRCAADGLVAHLGRA